MGDSPIGKGNVDLHKEEETAEWAALAKTGLGLLGPGDGAPNQALLLSQFPPSGRDGTERPADSDLSGRTGIKWNESRVAILAVPIALPDPVPAFARHWDFEDSHNRSGIESSPRRPGCQ